eukprot:3013455-Rhodomonas_salina.3
MAGTDLALHELPGADFVTWCAILTWLRGVRCWLGYATPGADRPCLAQSSGGWESFEADASGRGAVTASFAPN